MKNNLISAIAGWKSAALLAFIAMVAAVAFSGVLTTEAAERRRKSASRFHPSNPVHRQHWTLSQALSRSMA